MHGGMLDLTAVQSLHYISIDLCDVEEEREGEREREKERERLDQWAFRVTAEVVDG